MLDGAAGCYGVKLGVFAESVNGAFLFWRQNAGQSARRMVFMVGSGGLICVFEPRSCRCGAECGAERRVADKGKRDGMGWKRIMGLGF